MADFAAYWRNFARESKQGDWPCVRWFTNSDRLRKLVDGDRLWLIAAGENCGMAEAKFGYLVEILIAECVEHNTGIDGDYPSANFAFTIQGKSGRCLRIDPPLMVDQFVRKNTTDAHLSIGLVRRGPWRLKPSVTASLLDYLEIQRPDLYQQVVKAVP